MIKALFSVTSLLSLALPAIDQSADSILADAVKAQHAAALGTEIKDFEVSLMLQVNDPEKGRIQFDVERKFKAPDKMRTHIKEDALSGADYDEGYDGKVAWRYDHTKKTLLRFEGPDYRTDRAKVRRELDDMRKLLEFFFLEKVKDQVQNLKRLPDSSSADGSCHSYVLAGHADLEQHGGPVSVTVWIQKETYLLLGARIEYDDRPGENLHFCFWHHRKTPQGVVFPGSIKIYRNKGLDEPGQPTEEIFLGTVDVDDGKDLNGITFNQGLADDIFSAPEE